MSWEKLGRAKDYVGMGFKGLECFSLALFAKQGWKLVRNPNSLEAKILKEKYRSSDNFL